MRDEIVTDLEKRLEAAERLYITVRSELSRTLVERDALLDVCEALIERFGPVETWDGMARTDLERAIAVVMKMRTR